MAVSRKDYEDIKHSMGQRSAKEFVKASGAKSKALKEKTGRKTVFVGKVERKNGYYFAHGNRTKHSKSQYTHESDRKYGTSGMGESHAKALGSLVEADWRFRHGRKEAPRNAKFSMK